MTYHHDRNDRSGQAHRDGMRGGTIAMLALGGFLVVGGLIYAMWGLGDQSASTAQSPPATVGGGGAPASSGNAQRP